MCGRLEEARSTGSEQQERDRVESLSGETAFVELWQGHAADLFQHCLIWTGGRRAEAEEAFSRASLQIFVKYQSHRDRLRDPRAWMLRIARNTCVDVFRESKRRREELLEDEQEVGPTVLSHAGLGPCDPERQLLGKELRAFLHGSIEELPVRLRETVRSHLDLADSRRTADHLAISEVNLRKRLQLARDRLRERLASYRAGRARLPALGEPEGRSAQAPPWLGRVEALRWFDHQAAGRGPSEPLLALRYRPSERGGGSRKALERYVREHPTGWARRLDLARERLRAGCLEEAAADLEAVVARQPRRLEPWLELAEARGLLAGGEAAVAVCSRAQAAVSGEGPRLYLRGLEARFAGRAVAAEEAWRLAAGVAPATAAPWIALAELHEKAGRPSEAVESLDLALALDAADQAALTAGHRSLRLAGRRFEGQRRDDRALEGDEANPVALVRWLCAQGRAPAGASAVAGLAAGRRRRLAELAESSSAARRGLAAVHLAAGDPVTAGRLLSALVVERPEDPRGWAAFARLLERQGRLAEAWSFLKRAREAGPPSRELELSGCRLGARARAAEAVTRFLDELLAEHGEAWDVLSTAAWSLALLSGPGGRALELSRRALHQQPRLPAAWIEHGRLLAHGELWREAAAAFETAWDLLPADDGWDLAAPLALDLCRLALVGGDTAGAGHWHALALGAAEALRPHERERAAAESKGFLREPLLAAATDE
ncbi:MAG TPA: sigma-70 family RNA polymerase sigma factor [Thermoanaerobaculia bacterium]|nr:sigma-70 family RNA polymerase sigma factor [Thermoanaerobaculia bacterium]